MPRKKSVIDRRAVFAFASAIAAGVAATPAAAQLTLAPERKGPRTRGKDLLLHREIELILKDTQELWNTQSYNKLRAVWDTDDEEPWYVTEDVFEPFFTWSDLDNYWSRLTAQRLRAFKWQFSNLRVKKLETTLALAVFDHFYESQPRDVGSPAVAGQDRCLALFRRTKGKWKHILFAQCPQGPEAYARMMREKIVTPEFANPRESAGAKKPAK